MATSFRIHTNWAVGTLAAPYSSGSGMIQLLPGTGGKFGNPTPQNPIAVTLAMKFAAFGLQMDASTASIFECIAVNGDILTVQITEGTTDRDYDVGDVVFCSPTAADMYELQLALNNLEDSVATEDWVLSQDYATEAYADAAGLPAGVSGQVQFNNGGVFAGDSRFLFGVSDGSLRSTSFIGDGLGLTNLDGRNIHTGPIPPAQLGSGAANPTTFLRGDSSWQTLPAPDAPTTSRYIIQQADVSLPNAQVIGSLATGLMKVTTTTGVISIATATDIPDLSATYQTVAGMSAYLTTAAAASTYQTVAGMSAYLTTAAAASTYWPIPGSQAQNFVFAAPGGSAGTPGFRLLVASDIPSLDAGKITTGTVTAARLGSGTANNTTYLRGDQVWTVFPALAATTAKYILQTSDASIPNAQNLSALTTGLMKVTTATGVITTAVGSDIPNIAESQVTNLVTDLAAKAPLASPDLTGVPTAPTAAVGTNTTQIATTAFVKSLNYAPLASPAFTGLPTSSALTINATWNNGATTFTGPLQVSITNTASNPASLLCDYKLSGVSQFRVNATGTGFFFGGLSVGGTVTATVFSGSGAQLTNLPATQLTGQVPVARMGTGTTDTTTFLRGDGTWQTPPVSVGTVTSVGLTMPGVLFNASVPGSPVTGAGTLAPTLNTQAANTHLAGPSNGSAATPTFRALVTDDLPAGTGTVTSVTLTMPPNFIVSGGPVTASGTLAVTATTPSITPFTASGSYTIPAGATFLEVDAIGAGGGGGSGARQPSGTAAYGGGGGASGNMMHVRYRVADLLAIGPTITVTIGNGGAGGAAPATDGSNGNPGIIGGATTLAIGATTIASVRPGGVGTGGTTTTGTGGPSPGSGQLNGAVGGASSITATAAAGGSSGGVTGTCGGGAGGGLSAAGSPFGGGVGGGAAIPLSTTPGGSGGSGGTTGGNGGNGGHPLPGVLLTYNAGTGGGGGGACSSAAGVPGTGGNGGSYGAGGGGGGGMINGVTLTGGQGNGGTGGGGLVVFTAW